MQILEFQYLKTRVYLFILSFVKVQKGFILTGRAAHLKRAEKLWCNVRDKQAFKRSNGGNRCHAPYV
jgi:hypothetical protein